MENLGVGVDSPANGKLVKSDERSAVESSFAADNAMIKKLKSQLDDMNGDDAVEGKDPKAKVSKDENRFRKITTRVVSGVSMALFFSIVTYTGHVYICGLIFLVECLLFRELVKVRYNAHFNVIEKKIPLFRTTQWLWFWVAILYTDSDFVMDVIKSNTSLHHLLYYEHLFNGSVFLLYSGTFVLTISTLQVGHIRFQVNQLCWTIVVLCLTVGQLKYIMHNVFNGLIWFCLPIMLVACNDSFAWLAGITCGRKLINKPFISLSPNKTWEGFIGGWIGTMIAGWYLSQFMAQFTWMVCPVNEFLLFPEKLECTVDPIFQKATNIFPSQIFELLPRAFVRLIPGIVDICSIEPTNSEITACISGEPTHTHHNFQLLTDNYPIQIHVIGLSMFASFVAPFGGFLASAIKRAYGIKDFDSIIPGHGGFMDRFDCQLLMALCTWVHYNTFVKMATISVPKMIYMYNLLKEEEKVEFLEQITMLTSN
jgi:phosphatidate cytidylyltransferase